MLSLTGLILPLTTSFPEKTRRSAQSVTQPCLSSPPLGKGHCRRSHPCSCCACQEPGGHKTQTVPWPSPSDPKQHAQGLRARSQPGRGRCLCHSWSDRDKAGDLSERQMSKAISRSPVSEAGMLTALQALEELKGKAY